MGVRERRVASPKFKEPCLSPFDSKRFRAGVLCDRFIGNLIQNAAGLALKYVNAWSHFSIAYKSMGYIPH
jgi:hypothetical protein